MQLISTFLLVCLGFTVLYFVGLVQFFTDYEVDKCEMTYMFEYPQFVKISTALDKKYPKYELTAYSEGRFTQNARNMDFKGVPVLFIPGNAGSHKQVRSLASIALRKALNSRTPYHFNYFATNLNGEYSGLSGTVLNEQLEYVNGSIYRILELYKDKNKPKSVVLFGHSMGALLALKIVSSLPRDSTLIPIVISLSGPLKRAPVILDYQMEEFYKTMNSTIPKTTTFVSLAGGFSDFLISPAITNVNKVEMVQAVTTNVPKSWVEANHVQILWCKQTVLALNRALFDSVDLKTRQISDDPVYRRKVFDHHLIQNSGVKIQQIKMYEEDSLANINNQGVWTEIVNKQYTINLLHGVKQPQWFLIPILDHHVLNVLAVNLEVTDWIFTCKPVQRGNEKSCIHAQHLSHKSQIAPSSRYKRRTANFNLDELSIKYPEMSHILIRVLPTDEPVVINIDLHPATKRKINVDLPKLWSLKKSVILPKTKKNTLNYDLEFPNLYHVWQSYSLFVEPIKCSLEHHAVARLTVPWGNENMQQYFTEVQKDPLHIRLFSSKPDHVKEESASVKLTLDPACEYTVSIKPCWTGILGQLARHYTNLLLVNVAVVVLLTFKTQLTNFERAGSFSLFFTAMSEGLKPYYLVTVSKLMSKIFSAPFMVKFLIVPDWMLVKDENLDFIVLPLLLYLCSVGIVWLLVVGFSISVVMLESSINKVTLKFLSKIVRFPVMWTDYLMSSLHKLPLAVAALLIVLTMSGCGALALTLGAVFYFLKLTQMSQDLIEEVLWYFVKNIARNLKRKLAEKFSRRRLPVENTGVQVVEEEPETVAAIESPETTKSATKEKGGGDQTNKGAIAEDKTVDQKETEDGDAADQEENSGSETEDNNKIVATETVKEVVPSTSTDDVTPHPNQTQTQTPPFTAHNSLFFHSSLFFIWALVTLLNIPIVLIWAHNFKYKTMMSPDPSFIPGLVLSMCAFPLWHMDLPKKRKWNKEVGQFIFAIAVVALIYAPLSLYRLNYLLTLVMVVVTLQQSFAPSLELDDEEETNQDKHLEDKYEKVKTKLE